MDLPESDARLKTGNQPKGARTPDAADLRRDAAVQQHLGQAADEPLLCGRAARWVKVYR